ncbi:hypothetical protein ACIQC5_01575 [Paenarthrobacter sp. NPDC092416]|uniref:hypothetical protein n=1 Tax=Paenarthrobacter sp. NPDC092416 TaxID=3364386 RepID=UPI003820BFE6
MAPLTGGVGVSAGILTAGASVAGDVFNGEAALSRPGSKSSATADEYILRVQCGVVADRA